MWLGAKRTYRTVSRREGLVDTEWREDWTPVSGITGTGELHEEDKSP